MNQHAVEVTQKRRFKFGENWKLFLESINDERIKEAETSLCDMLAIKSLEGKTFLDAGCGSGLFSLAAKRLGAKVHSFDYDPESANCARELKQRYFPNDDSWYIEEASVLDSEYIKSIGKFDIVYSWGVLHHTGKMWDAIDNITILVNVNGLLFISIYNRQQFMTHFWKLVKRTYNKSSWIIREAMSLFFYVYLGSLLFIMDLIRKKNPLERHRGRKRRGMNFFRDIVDWIGGWPFEVASPEEIFSFCKLRGFSLEKLKTCGAKHGCNEFVFSKLNSNTVTNKPIG